MGWAIGDWVSTDEAVHDHSAYARDILQLPQNLEVHIVRYNLVHLWFFAYSF